ncbi:MAG TPA: hypothetical protein VF426_12955 [Marmoricola sp.]
MSDTLQAVLLVVLIIATSIWVGGYIAIAVVARAATATLTPDARIAFFRSLGRLYFWVGTPALVVALAVGAVLARNADHGALLTTAVVVAVVLLVSFAIAVVQARRMTRLRRALVASPDDTALAARVRSGARAAGALRGVLGILSVVLVVIGAFLAT